MAKAAKTPKRKSAKKGETPKTRPAPLLEEEPIASDDDAGEFIIARPDGYYWRASDGKQEVGPFETFELAQADIFGIGEPVVERVQLPCVVDIESKWTLAGSVSVTVTAVAVCPPVLVAVIV